MQSLIYAETHRELQVRYTDYNFSRTSLNVDIFLLANVCVTSYGSKYSNKYTWGKTMSIAAKIYCNLQLKQSKSSCLHSICTFEKTVVLLKILTLLLLSTLLRLFLIQSYFPKSVFCLHGPQIQKFCEILFPAPLKNAVHFFPSSPPQSPPLYTWLLSLHFCSDLLIL